MLPYTGPTAVLSVQGAPPLLELLLELRQRLEEVGTETGYQGLCGLIAHTLVAVRQVADDGIRVAGQPQRTDVDDALRSCARLSAGSGGRLGLPFRRRTGPGWYGFVSGDARGVDRLPLEEQGLVLRAAPVVDSNAVTLVT